MKRNDLITDNVAFAETPEDVDSILSWIRAANGGSVQVLWVALEVDADIYLRKKGIVPILPSELITTEDRKNIFLESVKWADHWLDGVKLDREKIIFKRNFELADLVKNGIFFYFNHLLYLVSVLDFSARKIKTKTFILPDLKKRKIRGLGCRKERYLSELGELVAKKYAISVISVPLVENSGKVGAFKSFLNKIRNKGVLKHLIKRNKDISVTLSRDTKGKIDKKKILVFGGKRSTPFWRLEPLCTFLRKNTNCILYSFYRLGCISGSGKKISIDKKREEIKNSDVYHALREEIKPLLQETPLLKDIVYRQIDLSRLCEQKLRWILETYLPDYWLNYLMIKDMGERVKFDLLISASHASGDAALLSVLHYFEGEGLPALLVPHGVQYCRYPEKDGVKKGINLLFPAHYSHIAVVGEYVRDKLVAAGSEEDKIKCTGNLEYSKPARNALSKRPGSSKRRKNIVYFLGRVSREHHIDYLGTTFDEVMQSISDAEGVASKLDCNLIIKPHPAFSAAKEWIDLWMSKGRYRVAPSGKNINNVLLKNADIVIASRSSMAIEALDHDVPVIIFEHEQREILFFEDISLSLRKFKKQKKTPFIRATGFDELLHVCERLLNEKGLLSDIKTKYAYADPWIFNNRDGMQIKRITEFIGVIVGGKTSFFAHPEKGSL
jgi:hypothetical protein